MTAPLRHNGVPVVLLQQIAAARQRQQAKCRAKRRFPDEFSCRAHGVYQMGLKGKPLWLYRCPCCRGWHLTHREQPPYFAVNYFESRP